MKFIFMYICVFIWYLFLEYFNLEKFNNINDIDNISSINEFWLRFFVGLIICLFYDVLF